MLPDHAVIHTQSMLHRTSQPGVISSLLLQRQQQTAMSQQPVRTWQILLQRLSDLKTTFKGSATGLPQYEAVKSAYYQLRVLPRPMPRATLKKIVQEQQVGFINPVLLSYL